MTDSKVSTVIVESLYNAGIRHVFGVPGAKIDAIFNTLLEYPDIKLIVCRHEQNAVFMAAAYGRITGKPGVCIATSGPGASNLATGLLTATSEGDPVIALIGSVNRLQNAHRTHQSAQSLQVLGQTCKRAWSIDVEDQTSEILLSAFRHAAALPSGAVVVSLPADVGLGTTRYRAFSAPCFPAPPQGSANPRELNKARDLIAQAHFPVLCLGLRASSTKVVAAVQSLLGDYPLPTIETFQAAGALTKELEHLFYGRVGLFRNQSGDRLLQRADLVIMVGYDPIEYDASQWNPSGSANIIHIDYEASDYGVFYQPSSELLGSIVSNVTALKDALIDASTPNRMGQNKATLDQIYAAHESWRHHDDSRFTGPVHPLTFIRALQKRVDTDTRVCCDVGTSYIYMMRYFRCYRARHLLCSNGQQTLGVALPWAIAASLTQTPPCSAKVISIAGDGGFMFSAQELSTAVQQNCDITIFVWNDSHYNMVEFQEVIKYGRASGIKLGGVDFAQLATAFGAKGFRVEDASTLIETMEAALAHKGVSLVEVNIDYSEAHTLAGDLIKDSLI